MWCVCSSRVHTCVPVSCRVPRRAVPVAVESPGVGFKFPELVLGPELFVTWRGPCPLSCARCVGLLCWVLTAVACAPGTETQRLWPGQGELGVRAVCPGPHSAVTGWEDEGDKRQQRPVGRTSEMKALEAGLGPSQ